MDGMGDTWILWINNESNLQLLLVQLAWAYRCGETRLKSTQEILWFLSKTHFLTVLPCSFFFLVNLNVAFLVAPLCRKRLLLGYAPTHPKSAHSKSAGSWNAKCHPCAPEVMRVYPSFPSTSGSFFK